MASRNNSTPPNTRTRSRSTADNTYFQLPSNFSEYAKSTSTYTTRNTMADGNNPVVLPNNNANTNKDRL